MSQGRETEVGKMEREIKGRNTIVVGVELGNMRYREMYVELRNELKLR